LLHSTKNIFDASDRDAWIGWREESRPGSRQAAAPRVEVHIMLRMDDEIELAERRG
jgi:hypothetical protein